MRLFIIFFFCHTFTGSFSLAQGSEPKWKKWEVLGDTAFSREDFRNAIKNYSKAIKASKLTQREDYALLYKRSLAYLNQGQLQNAIHDIDKFLEQYPMAFQAFLLKAYLHRENDEPNEALHSLSKAQELNPESPDIIKWRAELMLDLEQPSDAKNEILSLPRQYRDPQTEVMLGLSYYQLDKNDSALYYFNQALRMDPFFYPALMYATTVCLEDNELDLALGFIERAMAVNSTDPLLFFYKGAILAERNELDEACRCLNRAFYRGIDDAADYLKEYCFNEGR